MITFLACVVVFETLAIIGMLGDSRRVERQQAEIDAWRDEWLRASCVSMGWPDITTTQRSVFGDNAKES